MSDLTPRWDDVDPAELDFGVGALDADTVALDSEPVDVGIPPGPPSIGDLEPTEPVIDFATEDVEEIEDTEVIEVIEQPGQVDVGVEDAVEFEDLSDTDQFDDGVIEPESVPDDFDLPG